MCLQLCYWLQYSRRSLCTSTRCCGPSRIMARWRNWCTRCMWSNIAALYTRCSSRSLRGSGGRCTGLASMKWPKTKGWTSSCGRLCESWWTLHWASSTTSDTKSAWPSWWAAAVHPPTTSWRLSDCCRNARRSSHRPSATRSISTLKQYCSSRQSTATWSLCFNKEASLTRISSPSLRGSNCCSNICSIASTRSAWCWRATSWTRLWR